MRKYRSDEVDDIIGTAPSVAATPAPQFLQHMIDFDEEQDDGDTSITEETIDEEYSSYVSGVTRRMTVLDPLKFWEVSIYNCHSICIADILPKTHRNTHPTIYKIALDYLPVQASSVPCERAFSSSGETDTKKRNRIKEDFMEELQILKFGFKKERLNFTGDLLTTHEELTGVIPELVGRDSFAERLKKGLKLKADHAQGLFNWDNDDD